MSMDPILLIGGTGALGRKIAEWLRARHPGVSITIAARDQARALKFADDLGNADTTAIDLGRAGLGLEGRRFSIVIAAFKDHAHRSFRFAQDRGAPYIALSEAAFEIAPLVAMHAHRPETPLALIGHTHGGLPAMIALALSRRFVSVDSITLGAVFDPDDPLPPGAEQDMARIMKAGPPPAGLGRRLLALAATRSDAADPPYWLGGCARGGRGAYRYARPVGANRGEVGAPRHGRRAHRAWRQRQTGT